MGLTKSDLYTDAQNEISQLAKTLGHPARIAILQHLAKINSCINGDLVQEVGLAQATISQHLRELKQVGLIQGTVEGVSMSYCINPEKWQHARALMLRLFEDVAPKNTCC